MFSEDQQCSSDSMNSIVSPFDSVQYDYPVNSSVISPENLPTISSPITDSIPMDPFAYNYNMQMYQQMGYPPYQMYWWQQQMEQQNQPYGRYIPEPNDQNVYGHIGKTIKNRTSRAPYSSKQLQILTERFKKSDRIDIKEREQLSKIINLTAHQIKVWFQNRRFKIRRDKEKLANKSKKENHFSSDENSSESTFSPVVSQNTLEPQSTSLPFSSSESYSSFQNF